MPRRHNLEQVVPVAGHGRLPCVKARRWFTPVAAAALLFAGTATSALAQTAPSQPPSDLSTLPPSTLVDPQAEKDAARIKSQTWRSAPVGQNKNWNLDIGHFKEDKSLEQDLRQRIDEDVDAYSGMRLRLPLKGGR